jgi:hypothetical protein
MRIRKNLKMSVLIRLILTILCFTTFVTTQGCQSSSKITLNFESLSFEGSGYPDKLPRIEAITNIDSPLPSWYIKNPSWLGTVDFTKCFIVVGYIGHQSAGDSGILITDIWQRGKTVYVRAQFVYIPRINHPAEGSPSHVVMIYKEKMKIFGEITFILLDDYGNERASTISGITK